MSQSFKCLALKHGVAFTSLQPGVSGSSDDYTGYIMPCCQAVNSTKLNADSFGKVNIPIKKNEFHTFGVDSLDDIFTKHRNWVPDDSSIDPDVCDFCIKEASLINENRLPYRDYTPQCEIDTNNPICHIDPNAEKKLIFLGPLLLESTCNFNCYICGSGNSTQWSANAKIFKKDIEKIGFSKNEMGWYDPNQVSVNKHYIEKIKSILYNSDFSSLLSIQILGGEPLYGKMFSWLLKFLDTKIDLKNVSLSFNTNVSIFPKKDILDIFKKFRTVQIRMSIDGIGNLQETIRPGATWETIDTTVNKWIKFRNKNSEIHLSITPTLSILNVNKFKELYDYALSKNLADGVHPLDVTLVTGKPYLDINLISTKTRKTWLIPEENKWTKEYNNAIMSTFTTNMNEDATKSSFWSVDEHRDNLNKCFRFLDVMEKITGTHFKNANPEMYNILKAVQSEL